MPRGSRPIATALLCAAPLGVAPLGASAWAQEATAPHWEFSITPYLWLSGVSGTLDAQNPKIPTQEAQAGFGDVLSHLNAIPIMGAAEVRYGRFGAMADIIAISVKSDIATNGGLFGGGSATVNQVIGSAVGVYRVVQDPRQSLDLGLGVRAFGISTKFSVDPGRLPGFSTSPGVSWADPIVAARYHLELGGRWGLTAYADIGAGSNSSLTWQALATVDFRLRPATVLRLGYRHLQFEYEGDRLRQNMRMSGPIIGATFQF